MNDAANPAQRPGVARLLRPRSIALVGASEDQAKFGGRVMRMLLKHGFPGEVYPVNPVRDTLFGLKTYPSLAELPEAPDLALMTLPAGKTLAAVQAAAARGAGAVAIISSGFSDAGPEGAAREREIVRVVRDAGMRMLGPNCLGIISAASRMALCSSPILEIDALPLRPVGFVSQSGALMSTFFDRAWRQGGGFTHGVSVGNQADLELCDFVDYLIDDPDTRVICTYIEGVKDAARLLETARRAREAGKPWLAVKAGRSRAGSAAAFSHTASIAGDHAVFAAVCRDEGITLMSNVGAMLTLANAMAQYPGARASRPVIVTPSGGGGALAADALADAGVELAEFTEATRRRLREHFPAGQAGNPVDFGARSTDDAAVAGRAMMSALHEDANVDCMLVAVAMAPPQWLEPLVETHPPVGTPGAKPVLFSVEAGAGSDWLRKRLEALQLPFTNTLGEAVSALAAWRSRSGYAAPESPQRPAQARPRPAPPPGILDEAASKDFLAGYGIPVNQSRLVHDAGEAGEAAEALGLPVVMKIVSPDIVHKTEAGGVMVGVASAAAAREAYARLLENAQRAVPGARIEGVSVQAMVKGELELIVGARDDAQFGPVLVFGAGGVLVELLPERIIARAPLARETARRLLQRLAVWPVLSGYRGRGLDLEGVLDAIERLSWAAADLAGTGFELDINPLIVGAADCRAVDARLMIAREPGGRET